MGFMSTSRAYELAQATDGTLSVSTQKEGLVAGIVSSLGGLLNGGQSGSVGLSSSIVQIGLPVGAAMLQKKQLTGAWGVPFLG